jgi:hypothetical protein
MNEERWQSLVENPIIGISLLGPNQSFIATNRAGVAMAYFDKRALFRRT